MNIKSIKYFSLTFYKTKWHGHINYETNYLLTNLSIDKIIFCILSLC
jgi:hypothetical protein